MGEKQGSKGGRRQAISPDDVLEVIKTADVPFVSTGQIADEFDASKPTVIRRLDTLEEEGRITSHVVGGNTPVWYLPEHQYRTLAEYTDDTAPDEPPRHAGSDGEQTPDGGAEGVTADAVNEVRRGITALDNTLDGVRDDLDRLEEKVARREEQREEGESEPDTWTEVARQESRGGVRIVRQVSPFVVLMLLVGTFLQSVAPGFMRASVPVIGSVFEGVVLAVAGTILAFLIGLVYAVVNWLVARFGLAARAEQGPIGSWYRYFFGDEQ